jgi:UDP-N-acetylglucosamine 4,6-dehydratase
MEMEIGKNDQVRYFIGDIRDKDRLRLAYRDAHYVIHAAAMKIVPTAEYNPMECVKTNILGTQNLIDVALEQRGFTRRIIAISSDKAVAPLNLYGGTKFVAEKLFLASNALVGDCPSAKFSVVRYGNVANSNGSVIPVFARQRALGLPFTLTHESMTRYWLTIEDAVDFTLRSLLGEAPRGEWGGHVYMPQMPSFKVLDLAKAFGGEVGKTIEYIGVRPGEKIHESIMEGQSSDKNNHWLSESDLREKIKEMGV